jgi:hypothetical protein
MDRAAFGPRLTACLGEIKSWFDPKGVMNPGKIVNPRARTIARSSATPKAPRRLHRARSTGASGARGGREMCNNNGHCRSPT